LNGFFMNADVRGANRFDDAASRAQGSSILHEFGRNACQHDRCRRRTGLSEQLQKINDRNAHETSLNLVGIPGFAAKPTEAWVRGYLSLETASASQIASLDAAYKARSFAPS
jgi:hypothetical protein